MVLIPDNIWELCKEHADRIECISIVVAAMTDVHHFTHFVIIKSYKGTRKVVTTIKTRRAIKRKFLVIQKETETEADASSSMAMTERYGRSHW